MYTNGKGFSQAELAEGICSASVISQIECDRKFPSAETLGKLADKLSVPLREIMGMQERQLEAGFQIDMVQVYIKQGDYAHALEVINELDLHEDLIEHQRVELLVCRADCLIKRGDYEEAVEVLYPFLEKQQVKQDITDELLCETLNKVGNAFYKLRDFEKAFSAYEKGYHISLRLPKFGLVSARVTHNLGLTCNRLNYKEDAKRYIEKSYDFYSSISDIRGVADALFQLAIATGQAEYMIQSRSIFEGLQLVHDANVVKQHYAFHVESQNNYKSASEEIVSIADEFEGLGDLGMSIYTNARAVMVCLRNDDLAKAKEYLDLAIQRKQRLTGENPYMLGYFYRAKSEYELRVGNYDACVLDAKESSRLCAIMGMYSESGDALEVGAKAYKLQGDFEKAYSLVEEVVCLWRRSRRGS